MSKILKPLQSSILAGCWALALGGSPSLWMPPTEARQIYAYQPQRIISLRQMALDLANQDRDRYRLPRLKADPLLSKAAQLHAEDMLRRNYFSHYSPEGKTPSDRFAAVGGRGGAAENLMVWQDASLLRTEINYGNLSFLERSWMNSPSHRQSLLDQRYGRFGFGLAKSGARLYAVQLFSFPK